MGKDNKSLSIGKFGNRGLPTSQRTEHALIRRNCLSKSRCRLRMNHARKSEEKAEQQDPLREIPPAGRPMPKAHCHFHRCPVNPECKRGECPATRRDPPSTSPQCQPICSSYRDARLFEFRSIFAGNLHDLLMSDLLWRHTGRIAGVMEKAVQPSRSHSPE